MSDASVLETDVAIVGAGPAGIAAAVAARAEGARTLLLDSAPRPGGQIWRHRDPAQLPASGRRWIERLSGSGAEWIHSANAIDLPAPGVLIAEREGRAFTIRWRSLVIATGATERLLPFPGWTLPNVFGVGGLQALLKAGASVAARRVIVAGSGPLLLPVASSLAAAGATIRLVAEQAPALRVYRFAGALWSDPVRLAQAARYRAGFRRARYRCGTWIVRVDPVGSALSVTLTDGRRIWTDRTDLVAVGYGLVPDVRLARLAGCSIASGCVAVDRSQRTSVPSVFCAGEPTGIAGADSAVAQGRLAGAAAAGARRTGGAASRARRFAARLDRAFALRPDLRALPDPATIVCRCEDVSLGEIGEGWSARQIKLYTRAGMGPCQGRVCQPALEFLRRTGADAVRLPLFPAPVGLLADHANRDEGDS